jgi:hypothetical protein
VGTESADRWTDWRSSDRETNAPPHTNANGNTPADADATSHADTNAPPDTDADAASHADGNPHADTSTNTAADALPNPDRGADSGRHAGAHAPSHGAAGRRGRRAHPDHAAGDRATTGGGLSSGGRDCAHAKARDRRGHGNDV